MTIQPEQFQASLPQLKEVKFLDTAENGKNNCWEVQVNIGDKTAKFKVYTGAEVIVITEATWSSLNPAEPFQQPDVSFAALTILN